MKEILSRRWDGKYCGWFRTNPILGGHRNRKFGPKINRKWSLRFPVAPRRDK